MLQEKINITCVVFYREHINTENGSIFHAVLLYFPITPDTRGSTYKLLKSLVVDESAAHSHYSC